MVFFSFNSFQNYSTVSIENGWFVSTRSEKRADVTDDATVSAAALLGRMSTAEATGWNVNCALSRRLILNWIWNRTKTIVQPYGTIFAN